MEDSLAKSKLDQILSRFDYNKYLINPLLEEHPDKKLEGSSTGPISIEKIDDDCYKVIMDLHVGLDGLVINKKVSVFINIKTEEIKVE